MKSYRLDVTQEEHQFLKILAARLNTTIKGLLLWGAQKLEETELQKQDLHSSAKKENKNGNRT